MAKIPYFFQNRQKSLNLWHGNHREPSADANRCGRRTARSPAPRCTRVAHTPAGAAGVPGSAQRDAARGISAPRSRLLPLRHRASGYHRGCERARQPACRPPCDYRVKPPTGRSRRHGDDRDIRRHLRARPAFCGQRPAAGRRAAIRRIRCRSTSMAHSRARQRGGSRRYSPPTPRC